MSKMFNTLFGKIASTKIALTEPDTGRAIEFAVKVTGLAEPSADALADAVLHGDSKVTPRIERDAVPGELVPINRDGTERKLWFRGGDGRQFLHDYLTPETETRKGKKGKGKADDTPAPIADRMSPPVPSANGVS
ncbi:MAG: hypothetical protein ACJ8F7_02640 [Gemmataceae bacterium]